MFRLRFINNKKAIPRPISMRGIRGRTLSLQYNPCFRANASVTLGKCGRPFLSDPGSENHLGLKSPRSVAVLQSPQGTATIRTSWSDPLGRYRVFAFYVTAS